MRGIDRLLATMVFGLKQQVGCFDDAFEDQVINTE